MSYSVYLKKGEEKRIIAGHPWVYANEVKRIEGKDKNGSLATVYSDDGRFIGKGYINHLSKILVRVFIRDEGVSDIESLFRERLKQANDYRKGLGYDNAYRLCFAESDNLPSLIIDRYDNILSVQFLSLGFDLRKEMIVKLLVDLFHPKGIYERSDAPVRLKEGLEASTGVLYGEVPDKITIIENGVKLNIDVKNGQKTGYFLDQKENRATAKRYCIGKTVLDCFSNSGGFSLNVAPVATSVTALDISEKALSDLRENAALNGYTNITTVCADVFDELRKYKKEGKRFGTIILDPPAFCKSAAEVKGAYRGYKDINLLAMKLVEEGGFLITASCSHYMTLPLFEKMLGEAARESGRTVRLVEIKVQAPDHPALLANEESEYLKYFVLNVI